MMTKNLKNAPPPNLSRKEEIILRMLISTASREQYGLELVKASKGLLKKGTIYVTLNRMEDKGYIESRVEEPPEPTAGPRKRLYKPTGYGMKVLAFWELAGKDPMLEFGG